jgi:hypothetical protein
MSKTKEQMLIEHIANGGKLEDFLKENGFEVPAESETNIADLSKANLSRVKELYNLDKSEKEIKALLQEKPAIENVDIVVTKQGKIALVIDPAKSYGKTNEGKGKNDRVFSQHKQVLSFKHGESDFLVYGITVVKVNQ